MEDLLVYKIDPESLERSEILRSTRQTMGNVVHDLAVGSDSISLLLNGGYIEISRYSDNAAAATMIFDRQVADATSIDWITENEILVVTPQGPKKLRFR